MAASTTGRAAPQLPATAPRCRLTAPHLKPPVTCETTRPLTLIGSRADCDLPINATDVSKLHCAILNTGRGLIAIDLCSRSGTSVGGKRAIVAPLKYGEQLAVGQITIRVEAPADGAPELDSRLGDRPCGLLLGGRERAIERLPIVIGRRSQCQVVLDTPDVSLAHAVIFELNGCPVLYDLGSRSGTFVNGQRVDSHWLKNDDVLHIGGEELVFHWDGPVHGAELPAAHQAAAPAPAPVSVVAPPPTPQPAPLLPLAAAAPLTSTPPPGVPSQPVKIDTSALTKMFDGNDDLAGMLAGVHAQVAGVRDRLNQRSLELDARDTQVTQREAQLISRESAFDLAQREFAKKLSEVEAREATVSAAQRALHAAEQQLARRSTELDAAMADVRRRGDEVGAAQQALEVARQELQQSQADLAGARSEVESARAEVAQERSVLAEQQRAWQVADAALRTREVACEDRRVALEERAQALAAAEAALAEREAANSARVEAESEAAKKIEHFKAALREASQALSTIDAARSGAAARPGATPAAPPPAAQPAAPGVPPAAIAPPTPGVMPAPIVAEPLFGGGAMTELTPQMQERLRVLRRVSDKPDDELLSQVLAEFAQREQQAPKGPDKRGKRWWS